MENTTNTGIQIAETILGQINTLDFWARARWGWKQSLALGAEAPGVMLNCTKGIKIIIKLDPSDTYSIEIGRIRGMNYSKKGEAADVYAEDLVRIIDGLFSAAFGSL